MSEKKLQHIAIIMDGNGRWAKKRGLPRAAGHKAGEKSVIAVIERCLELGIPYLSLYAFSTENKKRDKGELDSLFSILKNFMIRYKDVASSRGVRIRTMGDLSYFDEEVRRSIEDAEKKTANLSALTLNIGLNYGGRDELVRAFRRAKADGVELSEENFSNYLDTRDIPDPDLIIRTSGEMRLSNFMIYQGAYSELYFTSVLWPDFDGNELDKAIEDYNGRDRRFGKA